MQAMPIAVKTALSAHLEHPVEQFAKLADTIYSYSNTIVAYSKRIRSLSTTDANKIVVQSAINKKQPTY